MLSPEKEIQIEYDLRRKAHKLMGRVFGGDKKAYYLWRARIFGNIHFKSMNRRQLLMVIKELKSFKPVK